MNIKYATYVDHHPEIQYPVDFQLKENPELIIYCSDKANQDYLARSGICAEIINFKITNPADIATAQNICLKRTFERHNPDYVVWVQADIYITEFGHKLIKEFCEANPNCDTAAALMIQHLRLFIIACQSVFGITVIGKNSNVEFQFDGAYVNGYQTIGSFELTERNDIPAVDIGYLTIDQYKRHRIRHNITWRENDNNINATDKQYLKFVLRRDAGLIGNNTILPKNTYLYSLIEKMGLTQEYNKIHNLLPHIDIHTND